MGDDTPDESQQRRQAWLRKWRESRKELTAEYGRRWYQENRERQRAAGREWYAQNREAAVAQKRAYEAANKEQIAARARANYLANREDRARRTAAWKAANPGRLRVLNAEAQRRRRARKRGATVGPVDLDALWTGACALCGETLDRSLEHPDPLSPSVDHKVPLAKGGAHDQANLQWVHRVCNLIKGTRLP